MRIALYQSYRCHTEVLGFLLDALSPPVCGHDDHADDHVLTLYNEPDADSATFVRYYRDLFSQLKAPIVKPCSCLHADLANIDKIIMVTADDSIDPSILYRDPTKTVMIQHGNTWWHPSLPCHGGLSPYTATPFMFPVYSSRLTSSRYIPPPRERSDSLHLAVVGHVTSSKHMEEMTAFLAYSVHTRLTFFARQFSQQVHDLQVMGQGRVRVRLNLPTADMIEAIQDDDIDAMWVPIRRDVDHSTFKLSGALPLSYNVQKLLIVPDMIARVYELRGAVVYESGVVGFTSMLHAWDRMTRRDWLDLSELATGFVESTVAKNKTQLRGMLERGVSADRPGRLGGGHD